MTMIRLLQETTIVRTYKVHVLYHLIYIALGDALESMKFQRANYTAWLNGTESNFTMVCLARTSSE